MANTRDRENSLLASFLYADDMGMDKSGSFELDTSIFTSKFRQRVAGKINDETAAEKFYGYLSITLEAMTEGTVYEQEWADILAQTPFPLHIAKRIHSDLIKESQKRVAGRLR